MGKKQNEDAEKGCRGQSAKTKKAYKVDIRGPLIKQSCFWKMPMMLEISRWPIYRKVHELHRYSSTDLQ
jgi:hypothetical protein